MRNQRLVNPLRRVLKQGKNLVFLHGMSKSEVYYYDYVKGVLDEKETFKQATLFSDRDDILFSDYYIEIDDKEIRIFKREESFIKEITENIITGKSLDAKLNSLDIKIEELDGKCFIYIHRFDLLAEFYPGGKLERSTRMLENIKTWSEIKNTQVVANIVNLEKLKNYDLDLESAVYIGNPSGKEIQRMYLRDFLSNTARNDLKMTDLFRELSEISYLISSSNKTLKEARKIYNSIVKDNVNYIFNKRDFLDVTEKILGEKITLDDVILKKDTKDKILAAVDSFLSFREENGKNSRKGIILTGPSGTGKTFIAKAIASERDCFFLAPTLADLKGEYIGHTSAKVKRIFEKARANQPAILFIDEADTVFKDRNSTTDNDNFVLDMVNQFLVETDGMMTGTQKVFIIAATNRIESIDSAIKSRLSESITVELPGFEERKELFHQKLLKYNFLFKEMTFQDEICKKTENMSGRDIDNFVKKLYERVVVKGKYDELSQLKDDEETKEVFLEILKELEKELINNLSKKMNIEIKTPEEIKVKMDDIIGYENVKTKVTDSIKFLKEDKEIKELRKKFEIENQYGVLLHGSRGNGKTQLVEAIAKKENLYYIRVLGKDLAGDYRNSVSDKIRLIFDECEKLSKMSSLRDGILLFFDEFEFLVSEDNLSREVKGTLLNYLRNSDSNGLRNEDSKVAFFAATNYYNVIDSDIKDEIDTHVEILNPDEEEGIKILKGKIINDEHIQNLEDSLINDIYSKIKNNKKIRMKNAYDNLTLNEILPSASEIVSTFKEIKREAFNMNKISDDKLVIDNVIVENIFG